MEENKNNGKVQTNSYGINVLVETYNSSNQHFHHTNKRIEVLKVLTDEEIISIWENRGINDKLILAKNWIKKEKGYSVSNCNDETLNINSNSIVNYKEI